MHSFWGLIKYVRPYKKYAALNILCNILMVVFSVISIPALIPFLELILDQQELVYEKPALSFSIDSIIQNFYFHLSQIIINHGKERALIYICLGICGIYFFRNFFRYFALFFLAPLRNGVVKDLRQQLFSKMLHLPVSFFGKERKGDMLARISSDVQEVEWSILNVLETVVREPLLIVGSLGIMIYLSPTLMLFVLVLIVFTAIVIGGIGKVLKKKSMVAQTKLGELISGVEEGLGGLRIIKAFNATGYQLTKFEKINNQYRRFLTRILWRRDLSSPLSEFLGICIVAVLIWYGYREVQQGILTVPTFLAFLYAFFSVIQPSKTFSTAFYNIQKGMAAMERIDEVMNAENPIQNPSNPIPVIGLKEGISFSNVGFKYNDEEAFAIEAFNLEIEKGQSVALVGTSGSGKTTIVDLLVRFYDVDHGSIKIDGTNIKSFDLKDLRGLMGIVSQEPILFNDTIYNNVVFGLKNTERDKVIEACKIANAHDFIIMTEHGYETNIGDQGMKLSGGQRQRLTIARAILRNPPILILDEATSSLDSESERLVQEAIFNLMKDRTSIVVAHRLSTIQHVDSIVVMKEGRIVEQGKHHELLNIHGEYHKLVALQAF